MKLRSPRALLVIIAISATAACVQDLDLGSTASGLEDGGAVDMSPTLPDISIVDAGVDQGPDPPVEPLSGVTDIDLGWGHACAVSLGRLFCWGRNEYGELGLGDGADRRAATQVGNESNWARVEVAARSTCAVKTDDRLFCWGRNHMGQVGDGTKLNRTNPREIDLPGTPIHLSAMSDHFCAINDRAELWCWGDNRESNIGQGENEISGMRDFEQPTRVTADGGVGWLDVGAGDGHTCGLRADNVVMCWGRNTQGMAGGDSSIMQVLDPSVISEPAPPSNANWTAVRTGGVNTCLLADNDSWYCLGSAAGERLPGVALDAFEPTPIDRPAGGDIVMDTFHACQLTEVGELFCWGVNLDGLISEGGIGASLPPLQLAQDLGPVEEVAVGRFNTCVVVSGGKLFCRGNNVNGTVGANAPNGDVTDWRQVGQLP